MQKRITYVEWDNDKMQQCKALLNKENKAFWDYLDKHPNEHRKYMKKRNVLKDANMHPIQYFLCCFYSDNTEIVQTYNLAGSKR